MPKKGKKNVVKTGEKRISNNLVSIRKADVSSNWFHFINSRGLKKAMETNNLQERNSARERFVCRDKSRKSHLTKVLALDCEMVGDMEDNSMLGRVSIVNYKLECVYDKFVKPTSPVGNYRTRFSGLRESDLKNGAEFEIVQKEVRHMLQNKILVGHGLHNDFRVLKFGHSHALIRDTTQFDKFLHIGNGKRPSLKKLVSFFLGENIQDGEHDSVQDARSAMKLYIKYRHEWEAYLQESSRVKFQQQTIGLCH